MSTMHYDVIIIGTGAGGGTLAHRLAPTGKSILLLERGDYVPREKDNWARRPSNVEGEVQHEGDRGTTRTASRSIPHTNYNVGGNTKFYGAALFRLRARGLRRDAAPRRRLAGVADRLRRYGAVLHRRPRSCTTCTGSAARTRPSRRRARRTRIPPVSHEPRIQQLSDDFGSRAPAVPHAAGGHARRAERRRKSNCIRCGTCDGFPCLVNAKSDAQVVCVDPALEHPNVTLLTNAYVAAAGNRRLGPRGHRGAGASGTARRETYSADVVVVSCGAINSAALLLRSANEQHPNGLANSSDVVGRHYMGHINSVLIAISRDPNPTVFQKTLALNDFYFGSSATGSTRWATSRSSASSTRRVCAPARPPSFRD